MSDNQNTVSSRNRQFNPLLQIAGLVATGWLVWTHSVVPRLTFQSIERFVLLPRA